MSKMTYFHVSTILFYFNLSRQTLAGYIKCCLEYPADFLYHMTITIQPEEFKKFRVSNLICCVAKQKLIETSSQTDLVL